MTKIEALAKHLGCDVEDLSEGYDDQTFDHGTDSYRVMTDEEADEAWDEELESYIDDCILPEVPATLANYFDREAWKRDARFDGRGHSLSSYDGDEHEVRMPDGTYLFIYRVG